MSKKLKRRKKGENNMTKQELMENLRKIWNFGFPNDSWEEIGKKYAHLIVHNLNNEINEEKFKESLINLHNKIVEADGKIFLSELDSLTYAMYVNAIVHYYTGEHYV